MSNIQYIKVSKLDSSGNDLTNTLKSLSQITIPYTNTSSSVCPVIGRTDMGTYYTFVVESPTGEVQESDASKLGYNFTGSISTAAVDASINTFPEFFTMDGEVPISSSLLPYVYNTGSNSLQISTYPQKDLIVSTSTFYASGSFGGVSPSFFVELYKTDSTRTNRTRLTNSAGILTGGWKGPFTRQATIPSESISPGDILYLGTEYVGTSVSNISVKLNLDVGKVNAAQIFLSSTIASGTSLGTVPEPYFTTPFYNSDCQVLLNNINKYPLNPFLQDIDYSTNPLVPANIQLILSGTAAFGTVPQSYYTSLAQITPRYLGSKNQSSGVNQYVENAGNTDFGNPINVGTYGNVSPITQKETNIFEFEWGKSTYPMIQGYGQMKLSNILQASSKDLIRVIQKSSNVRKKPYPDGRFITTSEPSINTYRRSFNPLDPEFITGSAGGKYFWVISQSRGEFYTTLNNSNPKNSTIQLGNYSANPIPNPIMPNTSKVVSTGWGTPEKPNYMFTSSYEGGVTIGDSGTTKISEYISGSYGTVDSQSPSLFIFEWDGDMSKTILNSVGAVTTAEKTNFTYDKVINGINSGMTEANRWYLTLYRNLENPPASQSLENGLTLGDRLQPYNYGYDQLNSEGNFDDPLAAKGVYEIVGVDASFSNFYDINVVFVIVKPEIKFDPLVVSGSSYITSFPTVNSGSFDVNNGQGGIIATYTVSGNVEGRPGSQVSANITLDGTTVLDAVTMNSQQGSFFKNDVISFPTSQFGGTGGTPIKFKILANSQVFNNKITRLNIGTSKSTNRNQYPGSPTNGIGAFMWQATGKEQITGEEFIVVQDEIKGVGPGYFTDQFSPDYIVDNIETITKEYGSNKT